MSASGLPTRTSRSPETLTAGDLSGVVEDLCRLLPRWLPARRWYAGKNHGVPQVRPELVQIVRSGTPTLMQSVFRADDDACYQLLVAVVPDDPAVAAEVPADAVIGRSRTAEGRELLLYEAGGDARLLSELLTRFAEATPCGALEFHRLPGAGIPTGLRARPLTAEQSNTSVAYGDRLMLKVLRRILPGANSELEVLTALTRAGDVPSAAPVAWSQVAGADGAPPTTLCILQEFVPSHGDGWKIATARAQGYIQGDGAALGGFFDDAFALGQATARVHLALAEQLPTRTLDVAGAQELTDSLTARLHEACVEVPDLAPYARRLQRAYQDLSEEVRRGNPLPVQRVHGDLHLGQVLRTDEGWVLIDFEGEPGHPFEERRRPRPAFRDVAAMLRSFDYAARQALDDLLSTSLYRQSSDYRAALLSRRASAWAAEGRHAFCAGYTEGGGQNPGARPALLRALEADKAVYEALYEARNRPSWLPIPLAAVRRLAQGSGLAD